MKKTLVLVLTLVMVLTLAIPASAAVGSPTGSKKDLKPVLVSADADQFQIITTEEVSKLTEESQKIFAEAKEKLITAVPEGMVVRHFFYVSTNKSGSAVFRVNEAYKMVIMQFLEGEWVELEFTTNADGTITVLDVGNAPMVILHKKA